jgi:5'-nucleotidase
VKLALTGLLPAKPDLVVSGINTVPNLGDDIIYSGTVSAAIEGTLLGLRQSRCRSRLSRIFHFEAAAEFTAELVTRIQQSRLPRGTLLNGNVPPLAETSNERLEAHAHGQAPLQ